MDLSPRHDLDEADDVRRGMLASRRVKVTAVAAVLVVVAGFVIIQGLRNATLFFRNVDEAIEQRDDLGERRFRLQGRVIPASVANEGGVTTFEVIHNCQVASVRHLTDPPELFESPWIPVVLEGKWTEGEVGNSGGSDDHFFLSDRMLVKHTNEYAAENENRVALEPPTGFLDGCSSDLADAVTSS
ncbi:MAG: cytochrome c maturation protein CcmE [Actinomycetota bacterium]|nr:cytochrome c maturation protein CcmE [Actinomycetota bacterium]